MKEDAYTKSRAKNQVCAIFYVRVIWENVFYKEGDIMRGTNTAILQYRKKNWQIPKYRVENRRNTDTPFYDRSRLLNVLSVSRVFYLKHVCTRNQPQPSLENVTISRKARLLDVLPISS